MDSNLQQARQLNPSESASIFSKLTFLFTVPLFWKGEIRDSDIYRTIQSYSTTTLGNQLEADWEKERKHEEPWLLRSLGRVFGWQVLITGFMVIVVNSAAMTAKPLLVGQIVKFFDPNQKDLTVNDGIMYCCVLVACLSVSSVLLQFCTFRTDQLTQRVKISCAALVYRKLLKTSANQNLRGRAITLLTKDINSTDMFLYCTYYLVLGIFQIGIMGFIMYRQIGVSAVIALSLLILYFPLQAILGKCASVIRLRASALTDRRLRETQEVFTAARVIKMYTWEAFHTRAVENIRRKEMAFIRLLRCVETATFSLGHISNKLIFGLAIVSYVAFENKLTAEKTFTVTSCLGMLFGIIQVSTPLAAAQYGNFLSTLRRFTNLLTSHEVTTKTSKSVVGVPPEVVVKNLTVRLGNSIVLNNINLRLEDGLSILKGPTGSGKSTLLLTLMSEIQETNGIIDVTGTISYASQEPWLFPGTLRQNIIFGETYDVDRYNAVINVCSLRKDFESFSNGDATYLTDRGLNLSRGQKTRINLARCVYKIADIYLLDDCLSSLDNHVANNIFQYCIKEFLNDKICIMSTHSDTYIDDAKHVLELSQGSLIYKPGKNDTKVIYTCDTIGKTTLLENGTHKDCIEITDSVETTKLLTTENACRSIYQECNEEGGVTSRVYYHYFKSGGGIWVFLIILLAMIVSQCVGSGADYFVSIWVNAEQKLSNISEDLTNTSEYKTLEEACDDMIFQYSGIVATHVCMGFIISIAFMCFGYVASINIHRVILSKITNASMKFLDNNLSGNVLTKFSRDLGIIDEPLPVVMYHAIHLALIMGATIVMISFAKPLLFIPSGILMVILYMARRFYLPTGRSIRRLDGAVRSPIIGHLNATVDGLTTIRANQMQSVIIKEFEQHQDMYNSVMYMGISTGCAFAFFLDTLSTIYIGIIMFTIMIFKEGLFAGQAGLVITQSLTLSGTLLQFGIRLWADVENLMTSVERIMVYSTATPENQAGLKPQEWPTAGRLVYKDVDLKYPLTGDLVLKRISFVVGSREKLGVVGRTGAGKSSLISVLFRLYDFSGSVTIDGVETNDISLQHLRSKISIIPQDPFLFTGSIRDNLDPTNDFSDGQLWDALAQVEMKIYVDSLDAPISEGGNNFSIGQKQLICLARAILSKNVILILDEATANLDPATDSTIQKTIRNNFSDCTVITIAHRMHTIINSDKILVMDQGEVVEFGTPQSLLSNKEGSFYNMVNEAGELP